MMYSIEVVTMTLVNSLNGNALLMEIPGNLIFYLIDEDISAKAFGDNLLLDIIINYHNPPLNKVRFINK